MGRISPIGVTHSGSLYYNYVYGGGEHTFIGRLAPEGHTANPAALMSSSFMGGFASWSPDGRSVAFIRHRKVGGTDVYDLVVRSMATGEERVYRHSSGTVRPQPPIWFHSGAALLVLAPNSAASYPFPNGPGGNSFYLVDLKTGQFTETFSPRSDRYQGSTVAALSPDDRTLYMAADDLPTDGVVFNRIIARDLTTKQERLVFTLPWTGDALSIAQGIGLALSPDGRTLAVVGRARHRGTSGYASDDTRLFTVDVDGSNYRDRAGPFSNDTMAKVAWSKDGNSIYFVQSTPPAITGGGGSWQLMRVPASGGTPVFTGFGLEELRNESKDSRFARLTNAALRTVSFGPDGSQFLLSTLLNPIYEVWALDNVLPALKTTK